MRYALRAGLSFCAVEERLLFLDLPADRYFCLGPQAERAFARLYRNEVLEASDRSRLARLADAGLLIAGDQPPPIVPCLSPHAPTHSLIDMPATALRAPGQALALVHFMLARIELRFAGLACALARAGRRKQRLHARATPAGIAGVAAAFEACNALVSAHDRCLPRSLAVAHRLMAIGARPELVLAVKLGPFKAHAWVQCGEALVNERVEVARRFTPILIL